MVKFKIGDKVRIKRREGRGGDYPCSFNSSMSSLEGTVCIIINIEPNTVVFCDKKLKYFNGDLSTYKLKSIDPTDTRDFDWQWHSSMFEPVIEEETQNYNRGDSIKVLEYSGKIQKATYFIVNFTEHTRVCSKIREKCSDFCKIAKDMGATICISDEDLFPEFPTIEQLVAFVNKINELYLQKPSCESKQILITQKTLNEHEIKFQRPKASFSRGSVPKGNPICGRKHKTAIVVGHLSNQEISC